MKMNLAKILFGVKIALVALSVFLLCFLLLKKLVIGGVLEYGVDLSDKQSFVEGPFPVERTAAVDCDSDKCKTVVFEPVYFNVYAPRKFSRAEVLINYKQPKDLNASFGFKLKTGDYAFFLTPFNGAEGEWKEQKFEFDLKDALYTGNKLQFIVSGPGINASHEKILLKDLQIKLIK
jgi:hypothetical protein